ncbi:hypothetical protein [Anaeromicrobium sediminis]|uniref:Uncharacterized protein n=1 Tax=Anaeromicrobium sediminis TaxID=1478221 RepID=A0A267MIT1_9FIRM|nr:hypothetical protein [Anaeromicrobium sediminis]PAB59494.1 hypothetical protein CCE28_09770 [Anaeromicrobium sediminis]
MNSNIKNNILQIILGIVLTIGTYRVIDLFKEKYLDFEIFVILLIGLSIWGVVKSKWKVMFGTFLAINLLLAGGAFYLYLAIKSSGLK